jgi:hypothetical protein
MHLARQPPKQDQQRVEGLLPEDRKWPLTMLYAGWAIQDLNL